MSLLWLWWIFAVVLVGAELLVGNFYLLALGVAFGLGGVAALLGASTEIQLAIAAVGAIGGVFLAHRLAARRGVPTEPEPFDIGQAVKVQAWNADGTARVAYRGSMWNAEPAPGQGPRGETMYIVAMRGSTLIIADRRPPAAA